MKPANSLIILLLSLLLLLLLGLYLLLLYIRVTVIRIAKSENLFAIWIEPGQELYV